MKAKTTVKNKSRKGVIPNPGSEEAIQKKCICPSIDNHYGKGFHYGTKGVCFWISADCPLHSLKKKGKKS